MGKRLLSMLLAMLMVIGMFPMQVLATELGTPAGDILSPVTEVEANSDPDAEENIEEEPILDSPALEPIEEGSLEENEEINAVEETVEAGEETAVTEIATADDLLAFAAAVNAGDKFAGKTVKLTADIDLAGIQWQPIGGSTVYFAGEFDGNGKTISNLTNTEDVARKGLFGLVEDCYIHDLTLKDVKFSGTAESMRVGALAGNLNNPNWNGTGCIIKNVTVDGLDYDLNDTDGIIGGLIGYSWNSYIKGCVVKNADMNITSTADSYVGTMIGYGRGVTDNCYVEDFPTYGNNIAAEDVNADGGVVNYVDCKVEGATVNLSGTVSFGGFFGADTYNHWRNTFKNCDVTGLNVTCAAGDGVYTVGGFMSAQAGGYSADAIIGCDVAGTITNNGSNPESTFAGFIGGKWGRSGGASNCTADVDITAAAGNVAGFCGSVGQYNDSMSYTFEGCTSSGDVKTENGTAAGFLATASGTNLNLTVEDCTVTGIADGTTEAALIGNVESTTGEVNLNGNTVPEGMTEVGGNTELIKEPTWYEKGEADGVFTINTADELKDFAQKVKEGNTFEGKKVILGDNIDLAGSDWPMIGTYGTPFSGEFNGNGKTISNLTDSTANDHKGLFAHLNNAYVHDLTLKDVKFSGTCEGALYAGALVGEAESKNVIKNVDVNGITWNITSKNGSIGGLAGYSYDTNYIGCDVKDVIYTVTSTASVNIGGMVGQGRGVGTFSTAYGNTSTYSYENCTVTNMTADVTGKTTVGGFLGCDGYNHWANYGKDCTVTGLKVTCAADDAQYIVGGFMGSNSGANYGKDYAFEKCTTTGTVTATGNTNTASIFGGFVGYVGGRPVALSECTANVTINVGAGDVGGFCGETQQYFAHEYKFEGCVAEGNVTTANGTAGGFIANVQHGGDGQKINVVINNSEANNTATGTTSEAFIGNINDNKNGTATGGDIALEGNTVNDQPVTNEMIGGNTGIIVDPDIPEGAEVVTIGSAADFDAFAAAVNAQTTYQGYNASWNEKLYVKITADIDMSKVTFTTAIGSYGNGGGFSGTLDGDGHTLSNYTVSGNWNYARALFRQASDITVKDITFDKFKSNAAGAADIKTRPAGIIFASVLGTKNVFENVTLTDSVLYGDNGLGTLMGYGSGAYDNSYVTEYTFNECTVKNCTIYSETERAGILGEFGRDGDVILTVEDCTFENNKLIATIDGVTTTSDLPVWYNHGAASIEKDGKIRTYEYIADAIAAAEDGDTIVLADDTHTMPNSVVNKNITIKGSKNAVVEMLTAVNASGSTIAFEGVTAKFDNDSYEGLQHSVKVTYKDCTIEGTQFLYAPTVEFTGCTFNVTGDNYAVWTYGASDATFTNCVFNTDGKAILVYTEAAHTAEINVSGCTFKATSNRGKAAIEVGQSAYGNKADYTLNITSSTADSNFIANNSTSNLWGNKNNMDGDGMTVVINNEQVYPVITNWIQKADTTWYVEGQTEFTLTTAEQLAGLAKLVNDGDSTFTDVIIRLGADIDLAGLEWTPIGTLDASKQFMGEFNGNGKTISNMTIEEDYNSTKARVGLFSGLQGINAASDTTFAKVHNLTIANANITISGSNARAGVLAGNVWSGTYVENVTISGGKINTNGSIHAGGLAGYVYTSMVSNVTVDGIEINHTGEGTAYIGGVSGNTAGHGTYWTAESSNTMFNNCDAKNVKINVNASGTVYAGGFIGACSSYNGSVNSQSECEVINLTMTLAGDANYQAGGFAGQQNGMGGDSNCTATGTITSTGTNVASSFGGFIGSIWGRGRQHTGNTVDVDITVDNGNVGGFVGNMSQHTANNHVFTNCTVNGNVETQNGTAGGFIAQYNGWDGGNDVRFELNNCAVKGEVIGTTMAGGLVGYIGFKENGTTEYVKIYKNCTLPTVINAETTHSIANIAPETDWYEDEEIYRIGLKVTIEDAGRSISLSGEIFINQYFKVEGLDAEYVKANAGILFWDKEVTNETALIGTQTYKYEEALKGTTTFSGRSKGIPAKAYADELYIRIYVQLEDETYIYSDVVEYSVQDYCELVFEAESAGEQLKYTCASLLHYGAAAQTYFKYNLSDMANAVVPESYPAKEFSADLIDGLVSANTELIGTGDVEDKGKSLSLVDAIRINYYFAPVTDANWKVQSATLYVWNGVNGELTMENAKAFEMKVTKDGTRYTAQINGISASKYSETVYARACFVDTDGNAHYSDVVGYSVEEYAKIAIGNSTNANLTDLIKKMVVYGEDARLYFTK